MAIPTDSLDLQTKKLLTQTNKNIDDLSYMLKFDKSVSIYKEVKKLSAEDNLSNKISSIMSGFTGVAYLDNGSNRMILEKEIGGKTFFIEKNISEYDWKLSEEKIKINNFDCLLATTYIEEEGMMGTKKILVKAWFSPEINLQHGPEGFSGLPGLIIKLEKKNIVTVLSKIEFEELEKDIVVPNENLISEKDFNQIIEEMYNNRREYYQRN